jgi:hypothetical protein
MTRISDEWSYRGFPSVVLENRRIRVVVLPGVGARVLSFIDKENDADLLWHHPRRSPEPVVFGSASADVWWTGGIDDIFPTDFPCLYRNEQLPYLGELWTNAWEYRLEKEKNDVALTLVTRTAVSPFEVRKTLRLHADDGFFSIDYAIQNTGYSAYDWYFGIHPGVEVTPGSRLIFPIRSAVVDDAWPTGILAAKGTKYTWPLCPSATGASIDLSVAPAPEEGWWTFQYGLDVQERFFAVINPTHNNAYCQTFDKAFFPNLLFYLGYGGWRNTYSIIPQLATGWPGSLADAVVAGRQRTLRAGEATKTTVSFHCLTNVKDEKTVRARLTDGGDII